MNFKDPRFIIAYTIIIGFAAAYVHAPDDTMKGALIAAFAGAWGFYLGSSSGSAKANDRVDKILDKVPDAGGDGQLKGAKQVEQAATEERRSIEEAARS